MQPFALKNVAILAELFYDCKDELPQNETFGKMVGNAGCRMQVAGTCILHLASTSRKKEQCQRIENGR
jgi:hypothetical protein